MDERNDKVSRRDFLKASVAAGSHWPADGILRIATRSAKRQGL